MLNEEKKRKELRQSKKKLSVKKEGKIFIGATKVRKKEENRDLCVSFNRLLLYLKPNGNWRGFG